VVLKTCVSRCLTGSGELEGAGGGVRLGGGGGGGGRGELGGGGGRGARKGKEGGSNPGESRPRTVKDQSKKKWCFHRKFHLTRKKKSLKAGPFLKASVRTERSGQAGGGKESVLEELPAEGK